MQYELITYEGAKPKRRLSALSAWFICAVSAVLPLKLRVGFVFFVNFVFNHVRATIRLIIAFLARQVTHLFIFLSYFLVVGPTALVVWVLRKDYLSTRKVEGSFFTSKEPADSTTERFERQY